jgi:hypothetical protein
MASIDTENRMTDLVAEVTRWDKLKTECTIGYVMWSIWPGRDDIWGQPNGRAMTEERRTDMYRSFLGAGIQNVRSDTVITVAVKKSWIKNVGEAMSLDGLTTEDIPMLEWTEEGKAAYERKEFCPLEGMGRRGGVSKMYEKMTAELKVMERELERMKLKKGGSESELSTRKESKNESIKFLKKTRERNTLWAMRLIDSGERLLDLSRSEGDDDLQNYWRLN